MFKFLKSPSELTSRSFNPWFQTYLYIHAAVGHCTLQINLFSALLSMQFSLQLIIANDVGIFQIISGKENIKNGLHF